jgi:hypothetical protein
MHHERRLALVSGDDTIWVDEPARRVLVTPPDAYFAMPCCGFAVLLEPGVETVTCPDCLVTARVEGQSKAA